MGVGSSVDVLVTFEVARGIGVGSGAVSGGDIIVEVADDCSSGSAGLVTPVWPVKMLLSVFCLKSDILARIEGL